MERGPNVYGVSRALWDHPFFLDEPFTEREAWAWLIGAAAWKAISIRGAAGEVALQRGEFSFSVRFLAEKWQWTKDKTHRFLKRLEKRDMIRDTKRDKSQVYFISNYNKFQVVGLPDRDSNRDAKRDAVATAPRQHRDKEETGKQGSIETGKDICVRPAPQVATLVPDENFFIELPTNRYATQGEQVAVYPAHIAEYKTAYPAVDVEQELRAMRMWLLSNEAQRKTRSGMFRFINAWLSKAQNNGGKGLAGVRAVKAQQPETFGGYRDGNIVTLFPPEEGDDEKLEQA